MAAKSKVPVSIVSLVFRLSMCLLIACGMARFCKSAEPAENPVLRKVIDAWDARQDKVSSVEITWTETTVRPKESFSAPSRVSRAKNRIPDKDIICTTQHLMAIFSDKMRLECSGDAIVKGEVTKRNEVNVLNGNSMRTLVGPNADLKHSHAFMRNSKEPLPAAFLNCWPVIVNFRGLDPRFSKIDLQTMSVADGLENVRGAPCLVLVSGDKKIWLDKEHDFVVLRYMNRAYQTDIFYEPNTIVGPVPAKWKIVGTQHAVAGRQHTTAGLVTADVLNLKLNEKIRPETFDIEFPPNTYVVDLSAKQRKIYIQRPDGSNRTVTPKEQLRSARYDELVTTESGEAGRLTGKRSLTFWTIPITAIICVVIALLIVWKRLTSDKSVTP